MNLYEDVLQNHAFFFTDANLASDSPLHFKKNLSERI